MYMVESLIRIGLKEGEEFPSDVHETIAKNIGLFNSNVTCADTLKAIVQAVNSVPKDRIMSITLYELQTEFGLPNVGHGC